MGHTFLDMFQLYVSHQIGGIEYETGMPVMFQAAPSCIPAQRFTNWFMRINGLIIWASKTLILSPWTCFFGVTLRTWFIQRKCVIYDGYGRELPLPLQPRHAQLSMGRK